VETVVIGLLGLGLLATTATAIALAIRNGTLTAQVGTRSMMEEQLRVTAREFANYKARAEAQLDAARADLTEALHDLESCSVPGVQRDRLVGVLQKLTERAPPGAPTAPGARPLSSKPAADPGG
jgi:hypothetical protein